MTKSLKPSENDLLTERKRQVKAVISWAQEIERAIDEILIEYGLKPKTPFIAVKDPHSIIEQIFQRFSVVANQLRYRHEGRSTIEINDEYDVQNFLHSLLRIYFDDIRAEEHAPSYAGVNPRLDLLLKKEQIVIELKKTRPGLSTKKLRDDLIIDKEQYKTHPDCKFLYCFVYDPERKVKNAPGFMRDLSGIAYGFETKVVVVN